MAEVELQDCLIPEAMRGRPACKVFMAACEKSGPGPEMEQQHFEEAMQELGCVGFHADRSGAHGIFKRDTESITRTKYGSLRFARAKTRKCRDVPCLLLLGAYIALMVVMARWALAQGDPNRLLRAKNYKGETCGAPSGPHANASLIYYPELEQDMIKFAIMVAQDPTKARIQNFKSAGQCIATCPNKGDDFTMDGEAFKVYFDQTEVLSRCFSRYPKSNLYFAKCKTFAPNASTVAAIGSSLGMELPCARYAEEWGLPRDRVCEETTGDFRAVTCLTKTAPCDSLMDTYYDAKVCCRDAMTATYPHCGKYSLGSGHYTDNPLLENPVFSQMMSASATIGRAFGDTSRTSLLILLCGGVFSMFQGVLWSGFVQVVAGPVVWFTLACAVVLPLSICIFFYAKAGLLDDFAVFTELRDEMGLGSVFGVPSEATRPDLLALEQEMVLYRYLAYGFNTLAVVTLLVLVKLRRFIRVAIGMIKEASRALRQMPLMIVYPIWAVACIFALWFYFMYIAVSVCSACLCVPLYSCTFFCFFAHPPFDTLSSHARAHPARILLMCAGTHRLDRDAGGHPCLAAGERVG